MDKVKALIVATARKAHKCEDALHVAYLGGVATHFHGLHTIAAGILAIAIVLHIVAHLVGEV